MHQRDLRIRRILEELKERIGKKIGVYREMGGSRLEVVME